MLLTKLTSFCRSNVWRQRNVLIQTASSSSKSKKEPEIPKNILDEYYFENFQKENGQVYDKKPFKFLCEEGKTYFWCLCGQSKSQPFCDGTHMNPFLKIKQKPIRFAVKETKEYWLCNCKQTSNRPFCDGTHKREDIQEARLMR